MPAPLSRRGLLGTAAAATVAATACSTTDPLQTSPAASTGAASTGPSGTAGTTESPAATASGSPSGGSTADVGDLTVRVGSARFAESEIIAELYAQVLEANGVTVERNLQIGAREVYLGALADGSVDLVPEYSGNLLQFWDQAATAASTSDIDAALQQAKPSDVRVLASSPAEDKDSYCVTAEFSTTNSIRSLADLAGHDGALRLAGNPELAERPYGPKGLTEIYGVPADKITLTPIDDGGGPLTVQALAGGDVDLADIYTTTPAIAENNLVVLEDPKNMIIAQNVLAVVSTRVPESVDAWLDKVSAALTTDDLIAMNARSSGSEKAAAATIAGDWLSEKGLLG